MMTDLKNYKAQDITQPVNNIISLAAIVILVLILSWMNERDRQDFEGQINTAAAQCTQ